MQDNENGKPLQVSEPDDEYISFPGGIPKRWFNPAYYVFLSAFVAYASWAISAEITAGRKSSALLVLIVKSIMTHLSAFLFILTVVTIILCKGLERIMYYLDAKKRAEEYQQQAEEYQQQAEEYQQQAEEYQQQAEEYQQQAEEYRQQAEQERQRAEQIEAENRCLLQELQKSQRESQS